MRPICALHFSLLCFYCFFVRLSEKITPLYKLYCGSDGGLLKKTNKQTFGMWLDKPLLSVTCKAERSDFLPPIKPGSNSYLLVNVWQQACVTALLLDAMLLGGQLNSCQSGGEKRLLSSSSSNLSSTCWARSSFLLLLGLLLWLFMAACSSGLLPLLQLKGDCFCNAKTNGKCFKCEITNLRF